MLPISLSAQEKYFHELKGMEDSTGTTHLFYRMHEKTEYQLTCDNQIEYHFTIDNDVFHINTATSIDSLKFYGGSNSGGCFGAFPDLNVYPNTFHFYDNNPNKWIAEGYSGCGGIKIWDYLGRSTGIPQACITKSKKRVDFNFSDYSRFILSPNQDTIFFDYYSTSLRFTIGDDFYPKLSDEDYFDQDLYDSLNSGLAVKAIHPFIDSLYYSTSNTGHLWISTNYSSDFIEANVDGSHTSLSFDSDSSILYSRIRIREESGYKIKLARSNNFGKIGSWTIIELDELLSPFYNLKSNPDNSGHLFFTDSSSIYQSTNFGETFEILTEMDYRITGLYKKPNSNILYVLTTDELFEVNTETGESISLKKLPVSTEELTEAPTSVKLHQNYPNPFNPSTTISFELNKPAEVRLTVFDALGRTISVLMDGKKTPGLHDVSFDASNLSSGIYFYRLETGAFSEVKRFTLIK